MIHTLVKIVKNFGQSISDLIARLILTLIYFVLLAPIALWQKWRQKPFNRSAQGVESFWTVREPDNPTLDDARREY